jgi:DNA-binding transcriptional MerR regulator
MSSASDLTSGQLIKISEFAEQNQLSPRALRLYEEQGLIKPAQRTKGGFRLYTNEQKERLKYIQKLQDLGCSLAEIREMIQEWQTSPVAGQGMKALELAYTKHLNRVRDVLSRLKSIEKDLVHSLAFLKGCQVCDLNQSAQDSCPQCDRVNEGGDLIVGIVKE